MLMGWGCFNRTTNCTRRHPVGRGPGCGVKARGGGNWEDRDLASGFASDPDREYCSLARLGYRGVYKAQLVGGPGRHKQQVQAGRYMMHRTGSPGGDEWGESRRRAQERRQGPWSAKYTIPLSMSLRCCSSRLGAGSPGPGPTEMGSLPVLRTKKNQKDTSRACQAWLLLPPGRSLYVYRCYVRVCTCMRQ